MGSSAVIQHLLDANIVTHWLARGDRLVTLRAGQHRRTSALSAIVLHELYFGAFGGQRREQTIELYESAGLPVLPFEREDARVAAELRADLKRRGLPIGPYDVLIAGHALARDLTLVTNNTREFSRIDGLRLADWTSA